MIRRLLANQGHPKDIAVFENDKALSYTDLIESARRLLPFLPRGQRKNVAILLPNGGGYIAALWGTLMAGMTAFPLNASMTGHEILPLLRQASVDTLITTTSHRRALQEAMGLEALPPRLICMDALEAAAPEYEYGAADIDADEPMLLLSTSGTLGKSKIVQLSERNIEAAVLGYIDKMRLDKICINKIRLKETHCSDIRFTLAAPYSCAYGIMILSTCLMLSIPIVVLGDVFTPDALYRAVQAYGITHYEGSASVIHMMERMAGRAIPYDIHTLKYIGFGGSKVSGDTIEKVLNAYPGIELYQGYGMTEAAPLIAKHPWGRLTKTDAVGTAIKGMEIMVEAQNAITSAPYTRGEILVRGPNVMSGYLDNLAQTNSVLKNGYLYTGDIGYLDVEGYLYICGRKKNIIIVRGHTVYPEEIEECILSSLLVSDCLVYGRADAYGGEMVCADIVSVDAQVSVEEISMFCETRLAAYKRPKQIRLCEHIPKNAAGKTQR